MSNKTRKRIWPVSMGAAIVRCRDAGDVGGRDVGAWKRPGANRSADPAQCAAKSGGSTHQRRRKHVYHFDLDDNLQEFRQYSNRLRAGTAMSIDGTFAAFVVWRTTRPVR